MELNGDEQASDVESCMRMRDELWHKSREWFRSRNTSIPPDDELITELVNVTYSLSVTGKFLAERKEDMKKRGLDSPDLADAFLLTFAGPSVRPKDHYGTWDDGNTEQVSAWAV